MLMRLSPPEYALSNKLMREMAVISDLVYLVADPHSSHEDATEAELIERFDELADSIRALTIRARAAA
ncbi:MAG TPA: hypothetical protein VFD90_10090 [Gaiellales bacterium]|jgi:hypothetical protein|nr:hypothetical protein [Gaiellales bacterium]